MTQATLPPQVAWPQPHPITAPVFLKMLELEILNPQGMFELIEGRIFEMPPADSPHRNRTARLAKRWAFALGEAVLVISQNPLDLPSGSLSLPVPDLVVVPEARYQEHRFTSADVSVVVEVSDSTLSYDRKTKLELYAREGMREYWIINVPQNQLEVYREPDGARYRSSRIYTPGERVALLEYPEVSLEWWV